MKEKISALMDGELDERAAQALLDALHEDAVALEAWRSYHLVSDAMRDTRLLSPGFAARVVGRLAAEPTALAAARTRAEPRSWIALSAAAASLAAVALVGWLAFAPRQDAPVAAPLAKAPSVLPAAPSRPAIVPLPSAARDYLLAHQGFSPRVSFQGMAPYVRTVSDPAPEAGK